MPLTANEVKHLKAEPKTKRYYDKEGLYLEVTPKGRKYWRVKYRFQRKEKRLSCGVYPEVTLKEARQRCQSCKKLLGKGVDPAKESRVRRETAGQVADDTFQFVALEWHEKNKHTWTAKHTERILTRLENNIFPWLGKQSMDSITAPELLKCLRRIEARGALDTAHRTRSEVGRIFRYGIATGKASRDVAADLRDALPPVKVQHHASITNPAAIGGLLRALDGYQGYYATRCALQLAPLLFVRPGELRRAEWSEFDLVNAEWRIPAEKMKMGVTHIVPLSTQALSILQDLWAWSGPDGYLFPGVRTRSRPMSENTINGALRRLGYTGADMTGHGFRSMASTLLHEQGWPSDAIERQLAHAEGNKVKASYNYAEHLDVRRKMMQAWSDYLDGLKHGAEPIPIHRK